MVGNSLEQQWHPCFQPQGVPEERYPTLLQFFCHSVFVCVSSVLAITDCRDYAPSCVNRCRQTHSALDKYFYWWAKRKTWLAKSHAESLWQRWELDSTPGSQSSPLTTRPIPSSPYCHCWNLHQAVWQWGISMAVRQGNYNATNRVLMHILSTTMILLRGAKDSLSIFSHWWCGKKSHTEHRPSRLICQWYDQAQSALPSAG